VAIKACALDKKYRETIALKNDLMKTRRKKKEVAQWLMISLTYDKKLIILLHSASLKSIYELSSRLTKCLHHTVTIY